MECAEMNKFIFVAAVLLTSHIGYAQKPEIIRKADLQALMADKTQTIQVINFWATWCGPCIKELPFFENLTKQARPDVKVTLVSLDLELDPDPEKVYKFVAKRNIRSQVLLLDEPDPNSWINQIEPQWSGSLPATIIINHKTGERKFLGRAIHEGELEQFLSELQ